MLFLYGTHFLFITFTGEEAVNGDTESVRKRLY